MRSDEDFDRRHLDAIADAELAPYWYEDVDEPDSNPTLVRNESCDLCVVGGGYTGLWTAIIAKERDPSRDVVLIDAAEIGSAASGRNGGFMESSLTHGIANGQQRFPDEIELLEQLGLENLDAIENAIHRYDIDCDFERPGVIDVATTAHPPSYLDELRDDAIQLRRLGQDARWLDAEAMRAEVDSPTYVGGLWRIGRAALVDPARLAWGLKSAAERLGVRIYEDTKATKLDRDGVGVLVTTPLANIRAARVALGTNAFRPLLRRLRHYIAPVYDYCMVTEPLTPEQLATIGWPNRQGLSDIPNQFHYYRLTEDNRILWGGYDTVYYFRGKVSAELESRPATWAKLSQHFFQTFPQLDGRALQPHLGRRHRHLQSLLRVLGHGEVRAGRLRPRLHGPRRGVDPLRRRRDARPARRPAQRRHVHRLRQGQAAAVPPGAVPLRRHPGDPLVARPRGPHRQAQPLAAHARPPRPRLRQLTAPAPRPSPSECLQPTECLRRGCPAAGTRIVTAVGPGPRRGARRTRRRAAPPSARQPAAMSASSASSAEAGVEGLGGVARTAATRSAHSPPHQARSPGSANVHVELRDREVVEAGGGTHAGRKRPASASAPLRAVSSWYSASHRSRRGSAGAQKNPA